MTQEFKLDQGKWALYVAVVYHLSLVGVNDMREYFATTRPDKIRWNVEEVDRIAKEALPESCYTILRKRFEYRMTYDAIAAEHWMSKERVHQLICKSIRKICDMLRKEYSHFDGEQKIDKTVMIDELYFPVRARNCFKRAGIKTVEELCLLGETKLMRLRNMGPNTLSQVKMVLIDNGYRLAD